MSTPVRRLSSDPLRPQPFRGPDAILARVTSHAPDAEPACPGTMSAGGPTEYRTSSVTTPRLWAERCSFDVIPRETWDRLADANPWSTPFSRWAFQRALGRIDAPPNKGLYTSNTEPLACPRGPHAP